MAAQQILPIVIPIAVLAIILMRNRRPRPLKLHLMWIVPLLVILSVGTGLYFMPHAPFGIWTYLAFSFALAIGALAGWWRGRTVDIHRDAESGRLMAKPSPLGLILIIGLFVIRRGADAYLNANAEAWHLNVAAVTEAFMLFAVGLVVAQRIEMFVRGRAIMASAAASA